jgi:hypothetical protein
VALAAQAVQLGRIRTGRCRRHGVDVQLPYLLPRRAPDTVLAMVSSSTP